MRVNNERRSAQRQESIEKLRLALSKQPMRNAEAAKALGVVSSTITSFVREVHAQEKIHIIGWHQSAGFHPVWADGPGVNAPIPGEAPPQPDRHIRVFRDPLVAALFGAVA